MSTRILLFFGLFAGAVVAHAGVLECNAEMKAKVLAAAKPESKNLLLDCNLRLSRNDVVSKHLIFSGAAASNLTLDCNGATLRAVPGMDAGTRITVQSSGPVRQAAGDRWTPPQNIVIKNCVIDGAVRVRGMAVNGEDATLTASSRLPGHTERVRANAPSGIVFSNNTIVGHGPIPIYFAPGVHDSMILDSKIGGHSTSVAIYLDAESGDNIIKGNRIDTETTLPQTTTSKAKNLLFGLYKKAVGATNAPSLTGRELIAVDASARNKIVGNEFSNLDNGGIFLYRNCGEGGNIRHQTPQGNVIVNNVFYYDKFDGRTPAIWLGSRNGNRSYCDLDRGYPLGSSSSDLDHASDNFVAQNQFYKFEPSRIVRDDSGGNILLDNARIERPIKRNAGCLDNRAAKPVLQADGVAIRQTINAGEPGCEMREWLCSDGLVSERRLPCVSSQ